LIESVTSNQGAEQIADVGWLEASASTSRIGINDAISGLDRTARYPKLIDASCDMAERFEACVAIVVGAGSVGQRLVDSLARLAVGGIWICDPRSTKPESILTHPISPSEVGHPKALLAARRAAGISPATRVRYFEGAFESLPLDALVGATHVFIASDNLAAEVAVTQACLRFGLPQLQASVYGPALVAQVRSLPGHDQAAGPCFCCGYVARDWEDLDAGTRFSCEGGTSAAPLPTAARTMSFPHLCAIAADLAVGELCVQILGLDPSADPSLGSTLEYCGYHGGTTRTVLRRNPECAAEHVAWTLHSTATPLEHLTPRELMRIAGYEDFREVSLRVEGYCFASQSACGCSKHHPLQRFVAEGTSPPGPCSGCGGMPILHPLHHYVEAPGRALVGHLDSTLADLGVIGDPNVLLRGGRGSTLVRSVERDRRRQPADGLTPLHFADGEGRVEVSVQ
jgi:ThiF family